MQLRGKTTAGALLLTLTLLTTLTHAHNITCLLAKHPEFSTFNHYLTLTHLAADINDRTTITVCAVDNSAMSALLSKHLSIYSIKNILSLHVLLDYFGAKKLHQITNGTALAATMFQATGSAAGSAGFVNITDLKGGKVGFSPEDNDGTFPSHFVKSVEEVPCNISVIQIGNNCRPITPYSFAKFLTAVKTPRPYWVLVFFDAAKLHEKSELHFKELCKEFVVVASSFIENNQDPSSPSYGLKELQQMDQGDFSRLAELMSEFIESKTKLVVGPIHRPPMLSKNQIMFVTVAWLICMPLCQKICCFSPRSFHKYRNCKSYPGKAIASNSRGFFWHRHRVGADM